MADPVGKTKPTRSGFWSRSKAVWALITGGILAIGGLLGSIDNIRVSLNRIFGLDEVPLDVKFKTVVGVEVYTDPGEYDVRMSSVLSNKSSQKVRNCLISGHTYENLPPVWAKIIPHDSYLKGDFTEKDRVDIPAYTDYNLAIHFLIPIDKEFPHEMILRAQCDRVVRA